MFFWIVWGIGAAVGLVALYIFVSGLGNGTVSSFNLGLWLVLLLLVVGVLAGSQWARLAGHGGLAVAIALILAVPAVLYLLFFLLVVASGERWN